MELGLGQGQFRVRVRVSVRVRVRARARARVRVYPNQHRVGEGLGRRLKSHGAARNTPRHRGHEGGELRHGLARGARHHDARVALGGQPARARADDGF